VPRLQAADAGQRCPAPLLDHDQPFGDPVAQLGLQRCGHGRRRLADAEHQDALEVTQVQTEVPILAPQVQRPAVEAHPLPHQPAGLHGVHGGAVNEPQLLFHIHRICIILEATRAREAHRP